MGTAIHGRECDRQINGTILHDGTFTINDEFGGLVVVEPDKGLRCLHGKRDHTACLREWRRLFDGLKGTGTLIILDDSTALDDNPQRARHVPELNVPGTVERRQNKCDRRRGVATNEHQNKDDGDKTSVHINRSNIQRREIPTYIITDMHSLLTSDEERNRSCEQTGRSNFRTTKLRCPSVFGIAIIGMVVASASCQNDNQNATPTSRPTTDSTATSAPDAGSAQDWAAIYDRTSRRFVLGDFIKPSGNDAPEHIIAMSPLIVREVAAPYADLRFGMSIDAVDRTGDLADVESRVIYFREDDASIGGVRRNRIAYLWLFEKAGDSDRRQVGVQGFRMTLDDNGSARFWEVLSPESPYLTYVAQSVENAAEEEFGTPSPGRRFAVERPIDQAPRTVVPRILADGPLPMGPFVYINGSEHAITTLLCRCMPSQVEDFRSNAYFELRRLPSATVDQPGSALFHERLREADAIPLQERIRIPVRAPNIP